MGRTLKVQLDGKDIFDGEIGKYSFSDDGFGGFTVTASAPFSEAELAAPRGAAKGARSGGGLGAVASPALQALATSLKDKSKASAAAAREQAQEQERAKRAATPSRVPLEEDESA